MKRCGKKTDQDTKPGELSRCFWTCLGKHSMWFVLQ